MATTFDIVAKLRADSTQFVKGMKSGEIAATNLASAVGGASQAIAVGTAAAVAVAGVALYKLGSSFHDAYKEIRVGTGATGEALDSLKESFRTVLGQTPASMDQVGSVIADLNTKLGLTGPNLENLSLQLLRLTRITGTDLAGNVEAVTTVFKNFGVSASDQKGKLDLLFRASQSSGVSVASLAQQMAGAGTVMRAVGFDFERSAALVAMLAKGGLEVRDVIPAMTRSLATAGREGKDASQLFGETFEQIRAARDPIEATGIALEVFGARGGPRLAAMIREGKLSYEEYLGSLLSGSETIAAAAKDVSTFSGKLKTFGNQLRVALEPLATAIFQGLNTAMKVIMPMLVSVADALGTLVRGFMLLPGPIQAVVPVIAGFVLAIRGALALKALVAVWSAAISGAFASLGSTIGIWLAQFLATLGVAEGAAITAGVIISQAFGPIMIVLGLATVALSFWAASQKAGEERAKQFRDSLDKQTGAWTDNTTEIVRNRLENDGVLKSMSESGITLEMYRRAVESGTEAMMSLSDQQRAFIKIGTERRLREQGEAMLAAEQAGQRLSDGQWHLARTYERARDASQKAREELNATGNAVDALLPLLAQVPGLQIEIVETLRTETIEYQKKRETLRAVGIAQGIANGLSADAAARNYDEAQANKAAADAIKKKHDELKAATDPFFANLRALTDLRVAQEEYDAILKDGTKNENDRRAAYDRVVEATGAYADSLNDLKVGLENGTITQDRVRERLQELIRLGVDPSSKAFQDLAARIDFAAGRMEGVQAPSLVAIAALERMKKEGLDPTSEAARGLQNALKDAGLIAYLLNGQVVTVKLNLASWEFWSDIRAVSAWLATMSPSEQTATLVGIASFRADGGPVSAGAPYIVGEQGPEVFIPGRSGTIIPNDAFAGLSGGAMPGGAAGATYQIVVNVPPTADKAAVGQATVEAIAAYERRSGAGWRS